MDTLTTERRSWNMSRIKGSNTGPERIVRSILHRLAYLFSLHRKTLPANQTLPCRNIRLWFSYTAVSGTVTRYARMPRYLRPDETFGEPSLEGTLPGTEIINVPFA